MLITCANCGIEINVPPELLVGIESVDQVEPYICDACENRRDLEADDRDHECPCGCEGDDSRCVYALSYKAAEQLKKRNLHLSGDVGKLSAINVVALDLLKRLVEKSREPAEGDCVYCNCELGGGNDDDCYDDCIMVEVRKLLVAAEQRRAADVALAQPSE